MGLVRCTACQKSWMLQPGQPRTAQLLNRFHRTEKRSGGSPHEQISPPQGHLYQRLQSRHGRQGCFATGRSQLPAQALFDWEIGAICPGMFRCSGAAELIFAFVHLVSGGSFTEILNQGLSGQLPGGKLKLISIRFQFQSAVCQHRKL